MSADGNMFQVDRAALGRTAGELRALSSGVAALVSGVTAGCPAAAVRGWRIGAALSAAVGRWDAELRRQAGAINGAAGRLDSSAAAYAAVEAQIAGQAAALVTRRGSGCSPSPGGSVPGSGDW